MWVSYRLTADEVANKVVRRSDKFVPDRNLEGTAYPEDYKRTGYDKGHLAPAADMLWSTNAMVNSFFMSNMSPQAGAFNRGIWKQLEEWTRDVAVREGSVVVLSGPIFCHPPATPGTIGKTQVEVPIAYYKVLCTEKEPQKAIGFILWNEKSDRPLRDFAVSVRHVEAMTGLDFYDRLPRNVQDQMELNTSIADWGL